MTHMRPLSIWTVVLLSGFSVVKCRDCGLPGLSVNAQIEELSTVSIPSTFPVGSHVTYKCQENQKLRGWPVRRCQEDGTWSGSIPWCDTNVAFGKNRLVWTNYWVDDTSVTTDGRSSPCFVFDADRVNQHFHFQSFAFYQVTSVVLHIEPRTFQEDRSQLQVGSTWCSTKTNDPPNEKQLNFECHSYNERIDSVIEAEKFVEFHLYNSSRITICEVEIYANSDQLECGSPDAPANGRVHVEEFASYHVAHYSCDEGFHLSSKNPRRTCYGRHWIRDQPSCIPLVRHFASSPSENTTGSMITVESANDSTNTDRVLIIIMSIAVILAVAGGVFTMVYLYPRWKKRVPCCKKVDESNHLDLDYYDANLPMLPLSHPIQLRDGD